MRHLRHLGLPALLTLAFLLRVWGSAFGLPHTFARPDEEAAVATALRFFGRHFDPQFYHWPSLFMYLVAAGFVAYFNVGRVGGWFPREWIFLAEAARRPVPLFLIARGVSVIAGTATVWLVHRIGLQLFDRRTALTAAFFLAVAALHVRDSHFGVPDVTATCLATASFLWTCRFVTSNCLRDLMISALCAGAAASTKYNLAMIGVPAIVAILSDPSGGRLSVAHMRRAAAYAGAAAAAFCIGSPYVLADWRAFVHGVGEIGARLRGGQIVVSGPTWGIHLFSTLRYGLGWPLLVAGIGGFVSCWLKNRRSGLVLASFPVLYFLAIGAGQSTFARYLLPVVPFLAVAAACGVCDLGERASRWIAPAHAGVVIALLAALVATPSAVTAIQIDRLLSDTDTRVLAAESIATAFPCGATIHQNGFVYGHVQLPTSGTGARYTPVTFDESGREFRADAAPTGTRPDLIVIQQSTLAYSRVSKALLEIVASDYSKAGEVVGTTDAARPVYDNDDAFYVPLAGFSGVLRPGPDIRIYVRRDYHPRAC